MDENIKMTEEEKIKIATGQDIEIHFVIKNGDLEQFMCKAGPFGFEIFLSELFENLIRNGLPVESILKIALNAIGSSVENSKNTKYDNMYKGVNHNIVLNDEEIHKVKDELEMLKATTKGEMN